MGKTKSTSTESTGPEEAIREAIRDNPTASDAQIGAITGKPSELVGDVRSEMGDRHTWDTSLPAVKPAEEEIEP